MTPSERPKAARGELAPGTPSPRSWAFRAMNTEVQVEGAARDPSAWFRRFESLWSRFDPDSALSQLNRLAGRWIVVPPLLHRAVARALEAARLTGGAFDPTILPALQSAGYSRSFELGATAEGPARPAGRWREVQLGPGMVFLPAGVQIDLGGIGKGLAVDLVLSRLRRQQPGASLLVNAGGDLALWAAPGERPWAVDVADPFDAAHSIATLPMRCGAVATSSTLGRRWGPGRHHIIDPVTGRPTDSGIVAATVFAPTAAQADVLAKASIVVGAERALPLLAACGCQGILTTAAGGQIRTRGLEGFICDNAE